MLKHGMSLLAVVVAVGLFAFGCSGERSKPAATPASEERTTVPVGSEVKGSDEKSSEAKGGESAGSDAEGSAAKAGTPADAIKGMLALAEAGKWEEYVRRYYGEKHKMDKPDEQIQEVASRIEKLGPKLIEVLKGCVGQEPALSDDGNVATFPNSYKLYKNKGSWGFHL
jgi:hypothetical protein